MKETDTSKLKKLDVRDFAAYRFRLEQLFLIEEDYRTGDCWNDMGELLSTVPDNALNKLIEVLGVQSPRGNSVNNIEALRSEIEANNYKISERNGGSADPSDFDYIEEYFISPKLPENIDFQVIVDIENQSCHEARNGVNKIFKILFGMTISEFLDSGLHEFHTRPEPDQNLRRVSINDMFYVKRDDKLIKEHVDYAQYQVYCQSPSFAEDFDDPGLQCMGSGATIEQGLEVAIRFSNKLANIELNADIFIVKNGEVVAHGELNSSREKDMFIDWSERVPASLPFQFSLVENADTGKNKSLRASILKQEKVHGNGRYARREIERGFGL